MSGLDLNKKLPFTSCYRSKREVYVSGQGPLDPATGKVVGDDIETQTAVTLDNITRILEEQGLDWSHVAKVNIYLKHRDCYHPFNEVYARYVSEPFPARTAIYCDLNYDILVEVDVIALIPDAE